MLTQNEITSLSLSPTKKDFVQIWNELLEVAGKLSERWDPTSTNESDPGIVILKALAGIADKLNYNIDKNTLEAFMPTAAQEDSMRKLCDMLGYNIKYYQSAKTEVTIKYHNSDPSTEEQEAMKAPGLLLPKFTVITSSDQDISYFTLNKGAIYISAENPSQTVECMEGQIVKCESINDNNVITANQISENNRFYLPETYIAENGIFIYNVFNGEEFGTVGLVDGTQWEPVNNLNVQVRGSRVYKFGYDSYESRPYIEFPEDYSELFNDGIFIYYARTSGASGNVSTRTLTKLELPTDNGWEKVSPESFSAENVFAATTGANVETIKQAYNNFKKTIGTFETLVTCRDYMNKIYSMVDNLGKPYVSNILVTDIRNDLNRAVTICSCDHAGIFYKEAALFKRDFHELNKPYYLQTSTTVNGKSTNWYLGDSTDIPLSADFLISESSDRDAFDSTEDGIVSTDAENNWIITQTTTIDEDTVETTFKTNLKAYLTKDPEITHFDLVFYPFKSYNQIKNNVKDVRKVYDASFNYDNNTFGSFLEDLKSRSIQTVAHNITKPKVGEVICINNYLRLSATIATNSKVTVEEGTVIKDKIKIALANAFNMRELDFGEEIPFDSIVEVIENADSRIRLASLNEPDLYTTFLVLDSFDANDTPVLKEYAVESSHLTLEEAISADRFNIDKYTKDDSGNIISLSTFNTQKAREIYNKLALRNVLAGRVPLFDYNNTFKTSFSEGAYEITNIILNPPSTANLQEPTKDNPFTVCTYLDKTYIGQWSSIEADDIPEGLASPSEQNPANTKYEDSEAKATYVGTWNEEDSKAEYAKIVYKETCVPELYRNNVITSITDENGKEHDITSITTNCKIFAENGVISDVELSSGEFVKFRAPNFTTIKTYPAYVNYHLALNKETLAEPVSADAKSMFELLDEDRTSWSAENKKIKWQKVFDFFNGSLHKQVVSRTKRISAFSAASATTGDLCSSSSNPSGQHENDGTGKCKHCGVSMLSSVQNGPIVIDIDESQADEEKDLTLLLNKSGCLKLSDNHTFTYNSDTKLYEFKAILQWDDSARNAQSSAGPDLDIRISLSSPFITDSAILRRIDEAVSTRLEDMVGQVRADGVTPMLPTEGDWLLKFEYEYVPFEPASLARWEQFVKSEKLFGFDPVVESGKVFWRVYGEGYAVGKYILQNSEKLLTFDSNYFGLLPESRLRGVYLIRDSGKDAQAAIIKNNEEYRLRANEYLYIEYTPSTTTEEGTSQEQSPVTEILGPGTIIKPSGFEDGLMDSSVYASQGNSPFKTVTFETSTSTRQQIEMQRFGANEQVEIRDFARVELTKKSFKATPAIYLYKNFNDCPELEKVDNAIRSYTLKDGEYIFYTDQNKAELAYFTTGTQVTLTGKIALDQYEVIDLTTVFDTGLSEIPWKYVNFSDDNDKIIFQEYQYITLGPSDTVKNIKLVGDASEPEYLSKEWQYCDEVLYSLAGSKEEPLPPINTYDNSVDLNKGCGWEACCTLELDVAYNSAQILRRTDKIQTSIELSGTSLSGNLDPVEITPPEITQPEDSAPSIAFKTNLTCQSSSDNVSIEDIYNNPKKLTGFEFKIFAKEEPAIVKTVPGKLVPNDKTITDMTVWVGEPLSTKAASALWYSVDLDNIKIKDSESSNNYDKALKLPISILPKTYGIFTVYVDYTTDEAKANAQTWIELLPGVSSEDITLFNTDKIEWSDSDASKGTPAKLLLNRGINCIRVNKTSRIFIKTSIEAQGSLLFDELKLVNCEPIDYVIKTGNDTRKIPLSTYGLNIKQLGYLNPADNTTTLGDALAIDEDMREKLKTGFVKDAFVKLDKLNKEQETALASKSEELFELSPKLQKIIKLVSDAKTELAAIKSVIEPEQGSINNDNRDAYNDLFLKYEMLSAELAREEQLLEALNESKSIENLEAQFSDLLTAFNSVEIEQQKILEELDALKIRALTEVEALDRATVLKNFDTFISTASNRTDAMLNALKKLSLAKVEAYYSEQLLPLVNSIEKVANSEERMRLFSVLSSLKEANTFKLQAEILTKVKQIVEAVNKTELNSYLDTALSAAISADYKLLHTTLVRLKAYLEGKDLNALIAELESAASENNNDQLKNIIIMLQNLVGTEASITTEIDNIINGNETIPIPGLDTLYDDDQKVVPEITSAVEDLCKSLSDSFNITLTDLLDVIYATKDAAGNTLTKPTGLLAEMLNANAAYNDTILELQNSKDSQVSLVLADILAVIDARDNYLDVIDGFGKDSSGNSALTEIADYKTVLPFGEEAVYSYWNETLKASLSSSIEDLYIELREATEKLNKSTRITTDVFDNLLVNSESAFKTLAERVYKLNQKDLQNNAHTNLIKDLSSILPESSDLTIALDEFGAIDTDATDEEKSEAARNAIIRNLVIELEAADTVADKQKTIKALKTELTNNININSKLAQAVASLLCPNILSYDEKLLEVDSDTLDDFYRGWYDLLSGAKSDLLNKNLISAERFTKLKDYLDRFTALSADDCFDVKLANILKETTKLKDLLDLDYSEDADAPSSAIAHSALRPADRNILIAVVNVLKLQKEISLAKSTNFIDMSHNDMSNWWSVNGLSSDSAVKIILDVLVSNTQYIENLREVSSESKDVYNHVLIEQRLLDDIRSKDVNQDFYYTAAGDLSLAIEFNKSKEELNTLMNPITNYDVNNINNSFVISKIDIDFLDDGLQLAHSSRLN